MYTFSKNAKLLYNIGYIYTEPRDADYKERNALEASYTDPLQMKEKSNTSPYLKYRQKHTIKATLDFEWKRISLGTNISWKSKLLAVDYLMVDEREKEQPDAMEYIRQLLYGNIGGETLNTYWKEKNTDYCVVDLRAGVKITKDVSFQFMINNLFNKIFRNCCLVLHKCSSENNTVSIINSSVYFVNELEKVVHVYYTCV